MQRRRLAVAAALLAILAAVTLLLWPDRRAERLPAGPAQASGAMPPPAGPPPPPAPLPPASAPPAAGVRPGIPATFEGRVLAFESGAGLAGAELVFARAGATASARTAADGTFRFQPPALGRWQLGAVSAEGYLPFAPEWGHSPIALEARAGERVAGLTIHLRRAVPYLGMVLAPDGKPVERAEVRLLGSAEAALLPLADRFTSGARGEFVFQAPDEAVLEARHRDFAPGRAEVDFPAQVSRRLAIRLGERPEAEAAREAIAGRVEDAAGRPVEGALVTARLQRGRGPGSAENVASGQTLSAPDGRFRLADLERGAYLLSAWRAGHAPARAVGVQSASHDVVLRLETGGALRGRVRDRASDSPVAPFTVTVRRATGPLRWRPPHSISVVDPSGEYRLDGLPTGAVVVSVTAPGHAPSDDVETAIPEPPGEAAVDFDLRPGARIAGRVLDRTSRAPIAGARIQVEGAAGAGGTVIAPRGEAASGTDGRFELGGLPARPLSIFVQAEGYHARILSGLAAPEGGVLGPVAVELTAVHPGERPQVELAGIGAQLTLRGDGLRILQVLPGGGAAEVGLQTGDEILAVDGRAVSELGLEGAIQAIRGPEGSTVSLRARRGREAAPADVIVPRRLIRN